jgi:hypothetical protein
MKMQTICIILVCGFFITDVFGSQKPESMNTVIDFNAESVLVVSFDKIADYVYIIGTTKEGSKVAYQVGGKPVKSDPSTPLMFNAYLLINDTKCTSATEIEKNAQATVYNLYVEEWRKIYKGSDDNKLMARLVELGINYLIIYSKEKDRNKFTAVPPVRNEKLKLLLE